jgi:hypothetical protein
MRAEASAWEPVKTGKVAPLQDFPETIFFGREIPRAILIIKYLSNETHK